MSKAVSDSTVLIFLAKLGKLPLLRKFYSKILIPEKVFEEVVKEGKKRGERDANIVENAIRQGWVEVKKAAVDEDVERFDLGRGESEALSLARKLGCEEILADEESVRNVARILKIKPRGTMYFLTESLRNDEINFDEYLKFLENLVEEGFYLSEKVYLEAVRRGRKISKRESN